ncbi:uncharacterized protein EDB91DRAFT_1249396 [Suillus paluster]|uniref:uncharacterized protein n=1 Tax=Suillus paluster TaxID=48578 RepID=UPI001B87B68E|nr:uncharacterized protein EDB91DRAFT_1249396 [Suillus paluster]KAG1738093.1 hypothetical protein EDB91DRAFT_1249396 [Suillus paluster]
MPMLDLLPKKRPPLRQIQEEFLQSHSEEFFAIWDPAEQLFFFSRLFSSWFTHWPEQKVLFPGTPFYKLTPDQMAAVGDAVQEHHKNLMAYYTSSDRRYPRCPKARSYIPADQALSVQQTKILAEAVNTRRLQITHWYCWKTNVSRLNRTSAIRGVLKLDAMLMGGVTKGRAPRKMHVYSQEHYDKKVKMDADKAICIDNITSHGPKLNKCLAVTQEKFEAESEEVKEEVERKYQEAKAKFARDHKCLRAGKMPKVNEEAKVKAIRELGPMLDCVFHYISHATGGWKFSVLMAGPDPTQGGTVVYEYVDLCELDNGVQFNKFCDKFNVVQEAFLDFTNKALSFEASLPEDDDEDESDNDTNNNSEMDDITIPTNTINGADEASSGGGTAVGEINNPTFHTDGLYRISPDSESQELQGQCSVLPNDFGSMEAGRLLDEVTQDQCSVLPRQLDFQYPDLNFNQLGLNNNALAFMTANDIQFQAPALDSFTPNFVSTAENHTTGSQNDVPQIQVPPLDSLTLNNLTTGPQFQAPFESISDMPLILPPPSTPLHTPHATDVCLPAVPDEETGPAGPDLDVAVPSPPNHR